MLARGHRFRVPIDKETYDFFSSAQIMCFVGTEQPVVGNPRNTRQTDRQDSFSDHLMFLLMRNLHCQNPKICIYTWYKFVALRAS